MKLRRKADDEATRTDAAWARGAQDFNPEARTHPEPGAEPAAPPQPPTQQPAAPQPSAPHPAAAANQPIAAPQPSAPHPAAAAKQPIAESRAPQPTAVSQRPSPQPITEPPVPATEPTSGSRPSATARRPAPSTVTAPPSDLRPATIAPPPQSAGAPTPDRPARPNAAEPKAPTGPDDAKPADSNDARRASDETAPALSGVAPDAGPDRPSQLRAKGIFAALRRTVRQFSTDNLTDWAAALTYYGVLSIFPGALVLVSLLGLLSPDSRETVKDTVDQLISNNEMRTLIHTVIDQVGNPGTASWTAIAGIVLAFWSASGYVAAFMRASNAVYDVPEGRPLWKTLPIRVAVTAVIGAMLIVSAGIVIFTGDLARVVGERLGFGGVAVTVWNIAKWPVLIVLVALMFAILYWASPNAKTGGFRWITPGGFAAVLLWLAASAGFAVYLANFANYDKTYGTLGGVIAFLVWLWISNIAILLGAELDAELERGRAIAAGHDPTEEPFLELRDTRKLRKPL